MDVKEEREIPHLRKSRMMPQEKEIASCVEECCKEPGMRKRLLVWALRRYTPFKLHEIAQRIKSSISYSAVSQICRRFEKECMENKELRNIKDRIEAGMSKVKT